MEEVSCPNPLLLWEILRPGKDGALSEMQKVILARGTPGRERFRAGLGHPSLASYMAA